MPRIFRSLLAPFMAALLLPMCAGAFYTPLSEQAVREAYFLGKRGDDSLARLLSNYTKFLPAPAEGHKGPHVASIAFLTPFALIAEYSSRQSDYSAQQAEKDHHPDEEIVSIEIRIAATKYDWPSTKSEGGPSNPLFPPESYNYWKAFQFHIFDGEEEITTEDITVEPQYVHHNRTRGALNATAEPQYSCGEDGCSVVGVVVRLQFSAEAFRADSATIEVTPPEGERVSVDFDLARLR